MLDDNHFRGAVGLSMDGYGALIYACRNPQFFSAVAARSPAIRTDDQIPDIVQAGWGRRYVQTWGVDLAGEKRLPERYYEDSVFFQIEAFTADDRQSPTEILIDTGDDEPRF